MKLALLASCLVISSLVAAPVVLGQADPGSGFTLAKGWKSHPQSPARLERKGETCSMSGVIYREAGSSFDFDLDSASGNVRAHVVKIDSFTIKQQMGAYDRLGGSREPIRVPGHLEFPQITFYIPEREAQVFKLAFLARHAVPHALKLDNLRFGCTPLP